MGAALALTRILPAVTRAASLAGLMPGSGGKGGGAGGPNAQVFEKVKEFAGHASKAGAAVIGLAVGIVKLSDVVLESKRKFMAYNATIGIALGKLEQQRTMRQFGTAAGVADSTADLAETMDRFEKTIQPFEVAFSNGLNRLLDVGLHVVNGMVRLADKLPYVGDEVKSLREQLEKDAAAGIAGQFNLFDQMIQRDGYKPRRPPMGDI